MIQSLSWNDTSNMLAALADGKFTVWYYPNTIYVDRDLVMKTVFEREARCVLSINTGKKLHWFHTVLTTYVKSNKIWKV